MSLSALPLLMKLDDDNLAVKTTSSCSAAEQPPVDSVKEQRISDDSCKASTHRHVLDLRALAEDLNVPQLGEVEISLEHLLLTSKLIITWECKYLKAYKKRLAHLVAAASEGVGGIEEAGVCRDVVLGAVAEREGELSVAARRDAVTPCRPFLELPPSGRRPEAERALGFRPRPEASLVAGQGQGQGVRGRRRPPLLAGRSWSSRRAGGGLRLSGP
ncbi:unnamed protein product [Miscanthus lutarioriparius]|uniref:Uncharacterized protein n=1 Tax=Miscanthus lutarioriparius TaxID=422564 RepID=A0A811R5K6_9POAL|nr:unnamed protein product [Miscanthus lutarioriparius]